MSDWLADQVEQDWRRLCDPAPAPTPNRAPQHDRNTEWCRLYEAGSTATAIGEMYGVTRERVCQVLRKENLIALKWQRNRLAREEEAQQRAAIKAQRGEIDRQIVELVRGGLSQAAAAARLEVSTPRAYYACQMAGVSSQWGRHRDFSQRIKRLTELRASGATLQFALETVCREEGRQICRQWVWRHCPQLCQKHSGEKRGRPPSAKPPTVISSPAPPAPPPPVFAEPPVWDDENTAELVRLWFKGTSAQQISDIFGGLFSRNAILGKLHRLRADGLLMPPRSAAE